jgi:hypothetical protein
MSNHPITPLASAQVNHDAPTVVDPNVSPIPRPRSPGCLLGRTSCWPQSGRSGDFNRAGRQGILVRVTAHAHAGLVALRMKGR